MCKCKEGAGCVECVPQEEWGTEAFGEKVRKRIADESEDFLIECKHAYYCLGRPLISDNMYDRLEDGLRAMRPDSYVLTSVGCLICFKEESNEIL